MLTRSHRTCLADDRGAVGVPADSIAAAQHGERAERFQPCGCSAQLPVGTMTAGRTGGGQPAIGRDQTCANPAEPPCADRRSRAFAAATEQSARRRPCGGASRGASSCVTSATCRPRMASRPRKPAKPGLASSARSRDSHRCTRACMVESDTVRQPVDAGCRSRPSLATTISAAADGVGARRSATKSAIVTSVSWPTAEIVGTGTAAIARATISSLNAQRSSIDRRRARR